MNYSFKFNYIVETLKVTYSIEKNREDRMTLINIAMLYIKYKLKPAVGEPRKTH